jgi:hypothetical protein
MALFINVEPRMYQKNWIAAQEHRRNDAMKVGRRVPHPGKF